MVQEHEWLWGRRKSQAWLVVWPGPQALSSSLRPLPTLPGPGDLPRSAQEASAPLPYTFLHPSSKVKVSSPFGSFSSSRWKWLQASLCPTVLLPPFFPGLCHFSGHRTGISGLVLVEVGQFQAVFIQYPGPQRYVCIYSSSWGFQG